MVIERDRITSNLQRHIFIEAAKAYAQAGCVRD